ncbi:MAG: SRPBCC family protein [Actinomycetota bacterium]
MQIENAFTVPTPVDRLWAFLLDVERIAPCMPGAELTEVVDDRTWKGKLKARFGPVAMNFAGTVTMAERDDAMHRVVLRAKGMESKGKGAADASVTAWLEPDGAGTTTVKMEADITMAGVVAQVSRGLLPDVSKKLTQQFADCLQAKLEEEHGDAEAGGSETGARAGADSEPVGGVRLGLWALLRAIGRLFGRLTGKSDDH